MTAATGARRSATFANSTDSDAIRAVLSAHGVTAEVDATEVAYEKLVQVDCTDWDYVVARAGASGLLVSMDDGKVSVKAPRTDGEAVLKVTYGDDLIALRADQTFPVERAAGTARRFRAQARFQGTAVAKVGALLELAGVGARFGGNALITSVCHEISAGSWITDVELGALPLPASPSWPGGVPGLRLGAVTKVDADPAGQFRSRSPSRCRGARTRCSGRASRASTLPRTAEASSVPRWEIPSYSGSSTTTPRNPSSLAASGARARPLPHRRTAQLPEGDRLAEQADHRDGRRQEGSDPADTRREHHHDQR